MTIFIYSIGSFAMIKSEIFAKTSMPSAKYAKSSLTDDLSEHYFSKVTEFMRVEKPYLNPEIKLSTLASNLKIQPNHLSQVINERFGCNFFDFINKYRIEEAKLKLKNSGNRDKMLTIALDCGFNNKVSFYKYFKKITGCTPTEFRRKRLGDISTTS